MPKPLCIFRIISRVKGRFLLSTSDTRLALPK